MEQAFNRIQFKEEDKKRIWAVVASVLLLGELEIIEIEEKECKIGSEEVLRQICKLLEIEQEALVEAITIKIRVI